MGKICKYCNVYDKNCTSDNYTEHIIRHVNDEGVLENYTLDELKQLAEKLTNDKDENGQIKDMRALMNVYSIMSKYPTDNTTNKVRPLNEQIKEVFDEYEQLD